MHMASGPGLYGPHAAGRRRTEVAQLNGDQERLEEIARARAEWGGKTWREGRTFARAYLIDLFQEMLERGSPFHRVDTHGGYMEIDTRQDLASAETWWRESAPE